MTACQEYEGWDDLHRLSENTRKHVHWCHERIRELEAELEKAEANADAHHKALLVAEARIAELETLIDRAMKEDDMDVFRGPPYYGPREREYIRHPDVRRERKE